MRIPVFLLALLVTFGAVAQVYELSEVDKAPVFAKGKMKSADFLRLYQTYPQSAYDQGIEGIVTLSYTVDSLGEVSTVKVAQGVNTALDKEAIRVATLFPYYSPAIKNGQPVNVRLQFPVSFTKGNSKVIKDEKSAVVANSNEPKDPLYVVDGKVLEDNANINPSDIKKIRIVKGNKATALYGLRAKDGLIMIETK